MVSPNLIKQASLSRGAEINESAKRLFQVLYTRQQPTPGINDVDAPRITVSTVISRVAFIYEKIRNAVQYGEESLIRKSAIFRILKRKVVIETTRSRRNPEAISQHLLTELIRAGYLANGELPESKIGEVAVILKKYLLLHDTCLEQVNAEMNIKADVRKVKDLFSEKSKITDWLMGIAACEVEENLTPNRFRQAMMSNLYDFLSENIALSPAYKKYEAEREIQIYLSICRTYARFDEDMLAYVLFKYYNDNWATGEYNEEVLGKAIAGARTLRLEIKRQINHPLVRQLDRVTKKYALYSKVMAETIEEDPVKLYNEIYYDEQKFWGRVRKVCNAKYITAKKRLWRAAVRSIIYIFITKSVFVVLLEVPATKLFSEPINTISLLINIIFPALLLFVIVLFTRTPGDANTNKIIEGIKELFIKGYERKAPLEIRPRAQRKKIVSFIFNLIYSAALVFSVYLIVRALEFIQFNWVSIIIFLFFLAFVSFFSLVTTRGVKDLIVVPRKENFFTFILDLFYTPIVLVGRWLSGQASKLNVFVFFFDFIIEAPFKVIIEVLEDWTRYTRERRDTMD